LGGVVYLTATVDLLTCDQYTHFFAVSTLMS
jgi:hypothetical protein